MSEDPILSYLQNGNWHNIDAIIKESGLPEKVALIWVNFLREYGFVEVDLKIQKARAKKSYLDFAKQIALVEASERATP